MWSFIRSTFIPITLLFWWHLANNAYPQTDTLKFFLVIERIVEGFDNGWIEGIKKAFLYRSDKAILHPILSLPTYLITKSYFLASLITTNLVFLTLVSYIYLLGSQILSGVRLFIWTSFLGTIPWLVLNAHGFTSELTFTTFCLAAFYHFYKSDYLKHSKQVWLAVFWLFLSFSCRPFLTLLTTVFSGLFFLYQASKKQNISKADVGTTGIQVVILVVYVLFLLAISPTVVYEIPAEINPTPWFILIASAVVLVPIALSFKINLNKGYQAAFTSFFLASFLVYGKFTKALFAWAIHSSFSSYMATQHSRTIFTFESNRISAPEFFILIFGIFGGIPLALLVLSTLLGKPQKTHEFEAVKSYLKLLLLSALPLILIGTFSLADEHRYYIFSFFILFAIFLGLGLHPRLKLAKLRLILISTVLALQLGWNLYQINVEREGPYETQKQSWIEKIFSHPDVLLAPIRPLKAEEPTKLLLEQTSTLLPESQDKTPLVVFLDTSFVYRSPEKWIFSYVPLDPILLVSADLGLSKKLAIELNLDVREYFDSPEYQGPALFIVGPKKSELHSQVSSDNAKNSELFRKQYKNKCTFIKSLKVKAYDSGYDYNYEIFDCSKKS